MRWSMYTSPAPATPDSDSQDIMPGHSLIATALALLVTGPMSGTAAGQETRVGPDQPVGPRRVMQFVMNRRARLGLKVNLRARATDSVGAYVDAVTPNGPAAKAGLLSGDVITKLDGRSVLVGHQSEADGDRESLPGLHLIELAAGLEPNDTVSVEFRRGKDRKTVSVVTADEQDIMFEGRPGGRTMSFRFRPDVPGGMPMSPDDSDFGDQFGMGPFLYGSPLADLELAPLNPHLPPYLARSRAAPLVPAP